MLISNTPVAIGVQEMMTHPDGFHIPIVFCHGFPYIRQRCPTDNNFLNLQQIVMTDDANWDPWIYDYDHLPDNFHLHCIISTPIDATDSFYNSEGVIVGANQAEHMVSWVKDMVHVFNATDYPLAVVDDNAMPALQKHHDDDDSSSDGSTMYYDNLDEQVFLPIPALTAQDVILNIYQLN